VYKTVFPKELIDLLIQVISSWQVLVVTGALVLYISLVSYVARTRRPPRGPSLSAPKKAKRAESAPAQEEAGGSEGDDDLGLEEE
jgi:hypothetical protein